MTDRRVFLAVVVALGVTLLACVVAIAGLAGAGKSSPGVLDNLASALVTGLLGLLIRGPSADPTPVHVVNSPASPVPVEESP